MTIQELLDLMKNEKLDVRLPFFNGWCTIYVKTDKKEMIDALESSIAAGRGDCQIKVKYVMPGNNAVYMDDDQRTSDDGAGFLAN